ncbi:MAG: nucleotidyl transferase AbiEii/AbiGii toxin family protein [Candidatus Saccharibacteria bacterium]|nr:nucleotidyl transferase AbiEii/AbiGii toxin family protein [Rhodoferax sp.]
MADTWFALGVADQGEALEVASGRSGRPAHLLEKDIWVVWALGVIYRSTLANTLTFKGGTSLSKVYQVIDRFSEDIDLTYDIRDLVPDLLQAGEPIPVSSSQEKKISSAVRGRLPQWIAETVQPLFEEAREAAGLNVRLTLAGKDFDKLIVSYPAVKTGTGYAAPTIQLEFGARATGEPHQFHAVACDMAPLIEGVEFPVAHPLVMAAQRTFWEKATAAHVYCCQGRLRGERYARHWYDLAALARSEHYPSALADQVLALQVAQHKAMFFAEKDSAGEWIDYTRAVEGELALVPQGPSLVALANDYAAMLDDGLLPATQPSFADLMEICRSIENDVHAVNRAAR